MPIKQPELYGPDWPQISKREREEAGNRCRECFVRNGVTGARDLKGKWWTEERITASSEQLVERWFGTTTPKLTKIVLTVHHMDQDPTNHDPKNLRALCQAHHLAKHRGKRREEGDGAQLRMQL